MQLQLIAALRFYSSILTVTGKSDFQFSKFYNVNRALEPNNNARLRAYNDDTNKPK